MPAELSVEIVFALPQRQELIEVTLKEGATLADAIEASGLSARFPEEQIDKLPAGVWGRPVGGDHILRDGDRVEIYRPLEIEPREARRRLAEAGRTMRARRNP